MSHNRQQPLRLPNRRALYPVCCILTADLQPHFRPTLGAGRWLGVEAAVEGVGVLGGAGRAHLEGPEAHFLDDARNLDVRTNHRF
jgi:hypothetical protein